MIEALEGRVRSGSELMTLEAGVARSPSSWTPAFLVLTLMLAMSPMTLARAASIEKARLLYDAMLLDDAKRELVETIASDTADKEKAAALHLFGTIAIDEKRYEVALKAWADLIARYPATVDAREAEGKLPLVRSLLEQSSRPAIVEPGSSSAVASLSRLWMRSRPI